MWENHSDSSTELLPPSLPRSWSGGGGAVLYYWAHGSCLEQVRVTERRRRSSSSSWMYFLVSTVPNVSGKTAEMATVWVRAAGERLDFCSLSSCLLWETPAHTWQILEPSGKVPSEEGMKSDGEQGKSGEWVAVSPSPALSKGWAAKSWRWLIQHLSGAPSPWGRIYLSSTATCWQVSCLTVSHSVTCFGAEPLGDFNPLWPQGSCYCVNTRADAAPLIDYSAVACAKCQFGLTKSKDETVILTCRWFIQGFMQGSRFFYVICFFSKHCGQRLSHFTFTACFCRISWTGFRQL